MARGRAHRYDSQRELILAQAAQLFARQGYSGTSMNQVAAACGISKPALYHYVRDKQQLPATIAQEHVARLEAVVREVEGLPLDPEQRVRELIVRFVSEYAGAQHAHRVLTEDVRFLDADDRERVLDAERRVLDAFAEALAAARPGVTDVAMDKPLAMLLFGMINWMFTWIKPDGRFSYDDMAPVVCDLFFGGLGAVKMPRAGEQGVRGKVAA